jgi:hypothetical protein
MKKKIASLLIFTLLVVVFNSCSKNDGEEIVGNWRWVQSSGGMAGIIETPVSTGKNILLIITEDEIQTYENDSLKETTGYTIKYGNSLLQDMKTLIIVKDQGVNQSFEINDDHLVLYDECYDCYVSEYTKE